MKLLLYSSDYGPRLKYICNQVFANWLGLTVKWTKDRTLYKKYKGEKINYGNDSLEEGEFLIPKCSLLFENDIKKLRLSTNAINNIPTIFYQNIPSAVFSYDLLANLFFHLSRYEEYLPYESDQYGRFPARESWAFRNECLQIPVVNLIVKELKNALKIKFPNLIFKKHTFRFLPTYDIDMAWAFRYKGWKRTIGGYAIDLLKVQFTSLKNRIKTHFFLQKDPFQTFDLLENWRHKYQLQPIYFFLLGDYAIYDKNNTPTNTTFQQLIKNISNNNSIGIHPSFQSSDNQLIIAAEKNRLAHITHQKIHRSRQHFLKLQLPATYRQLIQAGIKEDYSMGFATNTGFRAGSALPFYWYDLKKETSTDLLIYPFQVMDVTLKQYLNLSHKEAQERIAALIESTKMVNGVFCSLWHNSSFSELEGWKGWKQVYSSLLEKVAMEM